jgi:hypothetical protein
MTTGFVLTLAATCPDLSGSLPRERAISVRTCIATANRLLEGICFLARSHGPLPSSPIRNYYSYKCPAVNLSAPAISFFSTLRPEAKILQRYY